MCINGRKGISLAILVLALGLGLEARCQLSQDEANWMSRSSFLSSTNANLMEDVARGVDREMLSNPGRRPVIVVDIDDTIIDGRESARDALKEWRSQTSGANAPSQDARAKLAKYFARNPRRFAGSSPSEMAKNLGIAADSADFKNLRDHFWSRVFSAEYATRAYPIFPGARETLTELRKRGARIIYLTARPEQSMAEGTREILRKNGFPLESDSDVILRKDSTPTSTFKRLELEKVNGKASVLAVIDNNAEALVEMQKVAKKTTMMVLMATKLDHLPEQPATGLYKAGSWTEFGGSKSSSSEFVSRLSGAGGKLAGRLSVFLNISDGIKHTQERDIIAAIQKGECPSWIFSSTDRAFELYGALDLSIVSAIAAKCKNQGAATDFARFHEPIAADKGHGITQGICNKDGSIRLVHRNGTHTKIRFRSASAVASIETVSSDMSFTGDPVPPPSDLSPAEIARFVYTPDSSARTARAGIVKMSLTEKTGKTSERSESYLSFAARVSCAHQDQACQADQLRLATESDDDTTTSRTPFGANSGPAVFDAASSLSAAKLLLLANREASVSFEEFCSRVSGKPAPKDVLFPEGSAGEADSRRGNSLSQ